MNERLLYHSPLCPFSRKVRIALVEKGLAFDLQPVKYWEKNPDYFAINPMGQVPALLDGEGGDAIVDSVVILEYLDDAYTDNNLHGSDARIRAEARRIAAWFDRKFYEEAGLYLLTEKIHKRFMEQGQPDSRLIRAGLKNMGTHLAYIEYLIEERNWLAGSDFSVADITAAAHLSCVDYIGDVNWQDFPEAKLWYARVKSRPSFRQILADFLPGMPPPQIYAELDF